MTSILDHFPMANMREKQRIVLNWLEKSIVKGYRDLVVAAPTGCHAAGQRVIMYNGSVRCVEDIKVGDLLMGPDSKPRVVLRLCRGNGDMYRCLPTNGFESFTVNSEHVLSLNRKSVIVYGMKRAWHKPQTENVTVAEYLTKPAAWKAAHRLWRSPIDFSVNFAFEPGAAYALGIEAAISAKKGTDILTPEDPRLRTTQFDRMEMAAAILDKCGNYGSGAANSLTIWASCSSTPLIRTLAWLLRSLGYAPTVWRSGNRGLAQISIPNRLNTFPFRKLAPPQGSNKQMAAQRSRMDFVALGKGDFYGFELDGDHLYLLDDFTVTHNSGKTAIGIAFAGWLAANKDLVEGDPGAYYLCTQRLLQDQIEDDTPRYVKGAPHVGCLKSAANYECPKYGNCGAGAVSKKKGFCPPEYCEYKQKKLAFLGSEAAVTNYAYLLTERAYAGRLPTRQGLVCDETHNLSGQIMTFVELHVSEKTLEKFAPSIKILPRGIETLEDFVEWIDKSYRPAVEENFEISSALSESDEKFAAATAALDQHLVKIDSALQACGTKSEWIFWHDTDREGFFSYIARPIDSAPFAHQMLLQAGTVRLYMSAYPGVKRVFCRDLELEEKDVAWASLSSTFPIDNRKFHVMPIGSMGRNHVDHTLPSVLKMIEKLLVKFKDERGIIHCTSYKLGERVYNHFRGTEHGLRMLFPRNAEERDAMYVRHQVSDNPTVLLTPSMTEGFDFAGDLSRWSVLLKCPYMNMADKQVAAKMARDPDWFDINAVSSIIQAVGRSVRSETDYAATYTFDSDILRLMEKRAEFFPDWFMDAVAVKK